MASKVEPFRIVHLSDLHLTKHDNDKRSELKLFGKLTGMNAAFRALLATDLVKDSDLILVTGDVTDRGELGAWNVFWTTLRTARLQARTLVIPGNHDVCHLGAPRTGPKRKLNKRDLNRAVKGLSMGHQRTRFPWASIVTPSRLAIIALDSNNAGNRTPVKNAVGRIGFYQLEAFSRLLRRPQVEACPIKIVVLHHSPNLPKARRGAENYKALERWGYEIPEADRVCLRLLCATGHVRLVAHGHLHHADDRTINGVRMIGAPASTEPKKGTRTHQVWTYTIRGKRGTVFPRLNNVHLVP